MVGSRGFRNVPRNSVRRRLMRAGRPYKKPRVKRPPGLKNRNIGLFSRDIARARTAEEAEAIAEKYTEASKRLMGENPKPTRRERRAQKIPVGEIVILEQKKEHIREILKNNPSEHVHVINDSTYSTIEDSYFKRTFLSNINGRMFDKIHGTSSVLNRIPEIDEKLYLNQLSKLNNINYTSMLKKRTTLPAFDMRKQILSTIETNQVVLISGETGCGKTTQVCQFILDDLIERKQGSICKIICTQPRRISAIAVAERVAEERNEKLGDTVGYQIRLERTLPRTHGSICFCTTGVVLKQMQSNPALNDVSHLIIDEIHERSVTSDFLITVMQEVIQKRKDIKIILMSATLNAEKFSKYYGDCPHLNIPGFTFPVHQYFLEDVLQKIKFEFLPSFQNRRNREWTEYEENVVPYVKTLMLSQQYSSDICEQLMSPNTEKLNIPLVLELVKHICTKDDDNGAILIFLPGFQRISELHSMFQNSGDFPPYRYIVIPLHSMLTTMDQKQVFLPSPPGKRKIIISTNIAETSITIDDVTYVIDCGKTKFSDFDPETNTETLKEQWESRANADQRKGRAGRVKPGICYHLFTKGRYLALERFPKPEILRLRLDGTILTAKILQLGQVASFFSRLMDPPDPVAVAVSLNHLKRMNALDDNENLTPLGYHLARLPISPQMGKMILFGAIFSCLDPILSIAAALDFKDPFRIPIGREQEANKVKIDLAEGTMSDHILIHLVLSRYSSESNQRKFCHDNFLSDSTLKLLNDMKSQFMEHLFDLNFVRDLNPKNEENNHNSFNLSLVKAVICAGLYPNVALIQNDEKGRCICLKSIDHKKRLSFHPKSILKSVLYFDRPLVAYYLLVKSTAECIHDATLIPPLPLIFFGDHFTQINEESKHLISIGEYLRFVASEDTANLINDLRNQMNWFLEYKVSHPGTVSWTQQSNEVDVLRAIMELITIDDVGDMYTDDNEDEQEDVVEIADEEAYDVKTEPN